MKKTFGQLFVLLLALGPISAFAASSATGTVTTLHIGKNYGDFVFIKMNVSNADTYSSCHTNSSWNYTLPLVSELDKQMFSMLLVAYSSGAQIFLSGLSACNEFTSVESVQTMKLLP